MKDLAPCKASPASTLELLRLLAGVHILPGKSSGISLSMFSLNLCMACLLHVPIIHLPADVVHWRAASCHNCPSKLALSQMVLWIYHLCLSHWYVTLWTTSMSHMAAVHLLGGGAAHQLLITLGARAQCQTVVPHRNEKGGVAPQVS